MTAWKTPATRALADAIRLNPDLLNACRALTAMSIVDGRRRPGRPEWGERQAIRWHLRDSLKAHFDALLDQEPIPAIPSWSWELLAAALDQVDWEGLAGSFLDDHNERTE